MTTPPTHPDAADGAPAGAPDGAPAGETTRAPRVVRIHAGAPVTPPTRADGRPYRYELIFDDGRHRAYADDPETLLAALIDGYPELADPVAGTAARIAYATRAQVVLQARINATVGLEGCTDDERELLTGSRDIPPVLHQWAAPVPLVLVSSFYAPVGVAPRPVAVPPGELLWLDPGDAGALLSSLHAAGALSVATRTADQAAPPDTADRPDTAGET